MMIETARDELIGMLGEIGMSCTRPVTAYILGGGVLMMRGLKASTKDIASYWRLTRIPRT